MALNYAANFSGSNYLQVANYAGNPAAFSVSSWIELAASQSNRVFFSDFQVSGSKGWAPGIDAAANKIKLYLGGSTLTSATALTVGTWAHVVVTHDGTTAKIYLNGNATPDASVATAVSYGTAPTNNYIGGEPSVSQFINGRLAGVGYWGKALSTTEVASLYNSGSGLSFADLSGTLLTSLGSYHDFLDGTNLGADSSGNGRNYTNTGSVTQAFGPVSPIAAYAGRTQRPGRGVPQGRWSRGLAAAVTMPSYGAARINNDAAPGATFPTLGAVAWGRDAWGPCLAPNDSTGQGCVNLGTPIAAGATEFTLVALASTDTATGGGVGLRSLWAAETGTADMRLVLSGGLLQFQVGADGAFPNLTVDPPPLNVPVLITCRLAAGGVRSIWYGASKVAERTDAGAVWGSGGGALSLGSPTSNFNRNWSGLINAGLVWTLALPDAGIVALAGDFFAPVRAARMSPAVFRAANPEYLTPYGRRSILVPYQLPTADLMAYQG